MRRSIPASIPELNALHAIHPWLPNEETIRPTGGDMARKRLVMDLIHNESFELNHYILHTVFGQDVVCVANKKGVFATGILPKWVFQKSAFRYNLPPETNHYVLWFPVAEAQSEESIHRILTEELLSRTKDFEFGWYVNPKPSVQDFFHVQVFWIRRE